MAESEVLSGAPGVSYGNLLRKKREWMDQYQTLLHRIRQTKGLEGFLEHSERTLRDRKGAQEV